MTTSEQMTKFVAPSAKGADAYRDPPWWYDIRGGFFLMSTYQVTLWSHLGFYAQNLGNRHLEAAVGSGSFLWLTLMTQKLKGRKVPEMVVGIDYAERMLNGAKKLFSKNKTVILTQADLASIQYADGYFDSVNIPHSFHALPEPDKVLRELYRVMARGAKIYVDVLLAPRGGALRRAIGHKVNKFCFRKGILARICDQNETVSQFEGNGFTIADTFIKGNTLHIIARKP